jgi:uncharacterized protein YfkK (UPF0435 family)
MTNKPLFLEPVAVREENLPSTAEELDTLAIDHSVFIKVFNKEACALESIDRHLDAIENLLMDDGALLLTRKSDLIKIYQMIAVRKDLAHKFITKIAELGIKTDFLNKLLPQQEKEEVSRPNAKVREAVAILQKMIASKIMDSAIDV